MILFPPAKINLGLNVLHKREDGFHEISTCMYPISLFDVLEILPMEKFQFHQTGLKVDVESNDNLVVQAFKLIQQNFDTPNVYIHLRKQIPMGAGLGGGSADASYTLRALNELFSLKLKVGELQDMSAQLGSDCPFFISDSAQIATGRGELLTPVSLDLKGYFLKIINPSIHIGTAEAYNGVHFSDNILAIEEVIMEDPKMWNERLYNSFESSVFTKYPEIKLLKNQLYVEGAIYASMTGSGSTLYGLFRDEPKLTNPQYFEKVMLL